MKKQLSMLAAALCAVMMVGSLSVTAYAGGGDEYIEPIGPRKSLNQYYHRNLNGLDYAFPVSHPD